MYKVHKNKYKLYSLEIINEIDIIHKALRNIIYKIKVTRFINIFFGLFLTLVDD